MGAKRITGGYAWDAFDYVAFLYLLTHIPTTLLIDAQAVAGDIGVRHPQFAVDALAWHNAVNKDTLMSAMPPWFKGIVYVEVFGQVPFFVAAVYAWLRKANWIRIPTIIYGAHTATTLVPSAFIPAQRRA